MLSTGQMIDRLAGMVGTKDLSDWEAGFISWLVASKNAGQVVSLSEKQLEALERLHNKHFAS